MTKLPSCDASSVDALVGDDAAPILNGLTLTRLQQSPDVLGGILLRSVVQRSLSASTPHGRRTVRRGAALRLWRETAETRTRRLRVKDSGKPRDRKDRVDVALLEAAGDNEAHALGDRCAPFTVL